MYPNYLASHTNYNIIVKIPKSNYYAHMKIIMHPVLDYSKTNFLGQTLKLVSILLIYRYLVILRFTALSYSGKRN